MSEKRTPCRYGIDCYNKDPAHQAQFSHPKDKLVYDTQPPCRYGIDCYNKDPAHRAQFSHPKDKPGYDTDSADSSHDTRPPCRYGIDCYNTDPAHRSQFFHPQDESDYDDDSTGSVEDILPPCRYGVSCYNKNPAHLAQYSHPNALEDGGKILPTDNDIRRPCKYGAHCFRKKPSHFSKYFHPNDNDTSKTGEATETEHKMPVYWDQKVFTQSYRETHVDRGAKEFRVICDLLNSTVGQHGNLWGTIYGKDPVEFIVTKITRIHNKDLWEEHCFRKKKIMKKNNDKLLHSESSKYLKRYPLLVPLLDVRANEYWLFHGSHPKILETLLKTGYDPRVANVDGMFGGGFYLAENSSKSNQYIPCPACDENCISRQSGCQCRGQEDFEFSIILYRTVLGDTHIAKKYDRAFYCGTDKQHPVRRPPVKKGSEELYDSVMGECKKYGGDRLNYREFVVYESGQAYPEYVIKYKRSAKLSRPHIRKRLVADECYRFLTHSSN